MQQVVSIAIETSCRLGGVALGLDDELIEAVHFDASSRHATTLVVRLNELLARRGLKAADVNEVYACVGPGSFTGVRVGVTVARTLAQAVPGVRTVAVPTAIAVADNVRHLPWEHLAVLLDAKDEFVYAQLFTRTSASSADVAPPQKSPGNALPGLAAPGVKSSSAPQILAAPAQVLTVDEIVRTFPRPVMVIGEGLGYHTIVGEGITLADPALNLPTAEGVWRAGRPLARAAAFTEYHSLLPIYARKSEAERLWDLKEGKR